MPARAWVGERAGRLLERLAGYLANLTSVPRW